MTAAMLGLESTLELAIATASRPQSPNTLTSKERCSNVVSASENRSGARGNPARGVHHRENVDLMDTRKPFQSIEASVDLLQVLTYSAITRCCWMQSPISTSLM